MMKQGVRLLLIRKALTWRGVSKRFSILQNGKWLRNLNDSDKASRSADQASTSSRLRSDEFKYCCLSREDIIRFLIGCLGALSPLPLSSISSLGIITPHYPYIDAASPAIDAVAKIPDDPCAVAVIETNQNRTHKIIGEISAFKLWKSDHSSAAWAMASLTAGQFIMGADEDDGPVLDFLPNFSMNSSPEEITPSSPSSARAKMFSSRSIGFFSNPPTPRAPGSSSTARRNMHRGCSGPLTCKRTSSLAAVMAQLLAHRATHVWVTEWDSDEEEDVLVGLVGHGDVLEAVTKRPSPSS